jgi:1,2-diacylglycerol 3-alpha-glucosyltransferase
MWLNQTIFPDYRLSFVRGLQREFGEKLRLTCGLQGFGNELRTVTPLLSDVECLKNQYFLKQSLLWQGGLSEAYRYEGVIVTEFNLRTLSTLVLAQRRFRAGKPIVFWGHISGRQRHWLAKHLRKHLLSHCHGFICYTRTQSAQLAREYPSLPLWVAPNAICWFNECGAREVDIRLLGNIVFVGRLVKEKKADLLIAAFADAFTKHLIPLNARLIICGEGPERTDLERLSAKLGVTRQVSFEGHINGRSALAQIYSTAICAVSPGYIGLAGIQAFSFGVPMVIASGEPHSPEIEACIDGKNSIFFESGSIKGLSRALVRMFNERVEWARRRPGIAETLRGTYTFERMVTAFSAVSKHFEKARVWPRRRRRLKVCVFWDYYQAYHCARVRALLARADDWGVELIPVALHKSGRDSHKSELSSDLEDYVRVLDAGHASDCGGHRTALLRCLSDIDPDVLFTPGYTGAATLSALLRMRIRSRASVLMFETLEHDRRRMWLKESGKRCLGACYSAAFTGGELGAAYLQKLGFDRDRIFLGYDAVDNDNFGDVTRRIRHEREKVRERLRLPERYFLAVGRMIRKKGFVELALAYADYRQCNPGLKLPLVIVGDGPEMEAVRLAVKATRNEAHVLLPGYRKADEVAQYMALASALIVPSIHEEQWGLVINEAMASGIPVLASSICGGTPELVVEGVTGFSFDPMDRKRCADLLDWATNNPQQLTRMGQAAQQHVEKCSLRVFSHSFYKSAECAWMVAVRRHKEALI